MGEPSTIKPIFSIFRKDAGIDGEAQGMNQLAWMVFLKALDDREIEKEILDERYRSPIPEQLRWRSWATGEESRAGDALLAFVNDDLLPFFRELPPSRDDTVTLARDVFHVARNCMRSGLLLRQALDRLNGVDFNNLSSRRAFRDEFEALLGDLRGTGDIHAPPALAHFLVDTVDPELGETVLDPACGAGVFLVAAIERLRERWVRSPEHESALERSIVGIERSPLGWLLCTTHLLLHGLVVPSQVRLAEALARPLRDYGPRDRADVIVGVSPFGGTAPPEVVENFPVAFRTRDRTALHLLFMMHMLRPGGRAAIVVPDGAFFHDGIMARVREKLLEECDLHTIVRLPGGVLAPSTNIRTNILFCTQGRPTKEVWYYEHRHPEGLRAYSRKRPLRSEDFEPLRTWWNAREEGDFAFRVTFDEIKTNNFDLDRRSHFTRATAGMETEITAPPSPLPLQPDPQRSNGIAARESLRLQALRLQALRLRDFRGFAKLDLDLPEEGPVVLIGVNGAGKSTVLDAVAMFLSPLAALTCGLSSRRAEIQMGVGDIRVGEEVATAGATLRIDGEEQYWELRANRSKGTVPTPREIGQHARVLNERLQGGDAVSLPVLCFYSANRGLGDEGGGKRAPLPFRQLQAYDRAFRRGLGPFQDFLQWFRLEEDLENQLRLREDPSHRNPRLEVVRRAVQRFLNELDAGHFSDLRIERTGSEGAAGSTGKEGVLVVEKNGVALRVEQLSEGEKNTILLVSDLARRLSVANPGLEDPLRGEGIVLIDEIDLHLHPGWQRGVLPALGATFAGCQFLVSTHSPQTLSRIRKEQVIVFENFERVQVTPYTYGRDANSILSEVMGLPERPLEIEEKIRRASILIDEERLDEARSAMRELASILGEQDSEVVRLKTLIAFLND
jgi:type I restriction enzyme M protein